MKRIGMLLMVLGFLAFIGSVLIGEQWFVHGLIMIAVGTVLSVLAHFFREPA